MPKRPEAAEVNATKVTDEEVEPGPAGQAVAGDLDIIDEMMKCALQVLLMDIQPSTRWVTRK